nr:hypothetical protein [Tanacetum cinerariifolium]
MSRVQAWQEVVEKSSIKGSSNLGIYPRSFFNGHEIGSKKVSWVKWNNVLTDKKRGGLGVSSMYALNRGLMIKWLWKFFVHKDSIWTKVITAIYGVNGNVNSSGEKAGRSCWLAIVDEVRALHKKDLFPRMFSLENMKEVTVSSKLNGDNLDDSFRSSPRGELNRLNLDKLALGDKSFDFSAFKLSRLFFSLLSSGSSSCWRSYGAQ